MTKTTLVLSRPDPKRLVREYSDYPVARERRVQLRGDHHRAEIPDDPGLGCG